MINILRWIWQFKAWLSRSVDQIEPNQIKLKRKRKNTQIDKENSDVNNNGNNKQLNQTIALNFELVK